MKTINKFFGGEGGIKLIYESDQRALLGARNDFQGVKCYFITITIFLVLFLTAFESHS